MYLHTKNIEEWKQINYRNIDSMLSVQFIYDLYDQYSSNINWFRFKNVCLYYQDNKLWSYAPLKEWENILDNISIQFINPSKNSNPDIIKKCYWYYNRKEKLLDKFLKKQEKNNLKKLSDSDLFSLLFNWYQITLNQIYYINLAPVELGLQRAISILNKEEKLSNDDVSILYSLNNNTAVIREEYAFLQKLYNSELQDKDIIIDEQILEYGYVTIGYGSKPIDRRILESRYDKYVKLGKKSIEKRMNEIENYPSFIKKQKEEVYKKIKNKKIITLFDLAAKLGFMRDRKKAYLGKSVQFRNKIFDEISSRKNINLNELNYYIMDDFSNLLKHDIRLSIEEIDARKKGVYISNVSNLFSGEMAREKYFSSVNKEVDDITVLETRRGVCASSGKVTGIARVCNSFEDANKLKAGEILVTYGTDFDFMNAMIKSNGIITEEGGILSHASVISRELNKPCIIAFKGITSIIKNGDYIEMDAKEGKVSIINDKIKKRETKKELTGFYSLGTKKEASEIGNKAYNLSLLYNYNCNVPEAYFLGISFFENILKEQGKYDEYIQYADKLSKYKDDIYKLIDSINIPDEVFNYLDFNKYTYAVRSSSPNEDSSSKSFAGQYVTELFCNSKEFTIKSIKKCWKSLLGFGLDNYQDLENINTRFGGIIIQRMVAADYAGVMFTKDPIANNRDCIIIESCLGVASKLVDNKVVPDRYFINQETLEVVSEISKNKIPDEILKELVLIGIKLEKEYGCDVDIEWACKDNEVFIIQCRPITT